jgi:hypothetical protein
MTLTFCLAEQLACFDSAFYHRLPTCHRSLKYKT